MTTTTTTIYIILDKENHPIGASTDYDKAWAEVLRREREQGEFCRLMSVPNLQ